MITQLDSHKFALVAILKLVLISLAFYFSSGGQFSRQLGGLLSPGLQISSRVSQNCHSSGKQVQIHKKIFVKRTSCLGI